MNGAIYNIIMAILGILILLIIIVKVFRIPSSLVKKIFYNMIAGFVFLLIVNMFGGIWGFKIGINIITIAISAFMGVPGVVALIIIKLII